MSVCHTRWPGYIVVEFIGHREAGDDDNADDSDVDAALSADDSALQRETH